MNPEMQGADPADMERVARVIDDQRGNVEDALRELQGKVDALIPDIWNGTDAETFVEGFTNEVKPQFDDLIREMTEASDELRRQAKEQADVSAR